MISIAIFIKCNEENCENEAESKALFNVGTEKWEIYAPEGWYITTNADLDGTIVSCPNHDAMQG